MMHAWLMADTELAWILYDTSRCSPTIVWTDCPVTERDSEREDQAVTFTDFCWPPFGILSAGLLRVDWSRSHIRSF